MPTIKSMNEDMFDRNACGLPSPCSTCDCRSKVGYCKAAAALQTLNEFEDKVYAPKVWINTSHIELSHQFCGFELTLRGDGTYGLSDTTGG